MCNFLLIYCWNLRLLQCNPSLAELITETLGGDKWLTNAALLKKLESKVDDASFIKRFYDIKLANKVRLSEYIERTLGIYCDPSSLFSIQVKRIHEYKRQTMNAFSCIYRYLTLKKMNPEERKKVVPVSICIGSLECSSAFCLTNAMLY
jgi:starch phosphorylase